MLSLFLCLWYCIGEVGNAMKLITFAIPSYNSEGYLSHAVDTILSGGDDVEIIIVNDGSTDGTAAIADAYAEKYPHIVKVVHKENGGHGSGVNCGVERAEGLYFKVVDSDDWVDEKALQTLLGAIRTHIAEKNEPDLYITNFVYDHAEDNTRFVRQFRKQFPVGEHFGWDKAGRFVGSQLLLMHAVMFKTQIIRDSGTVLPEHTFYVDNLFAFRPLPLCKKLFYCDVDLYHYFIGRADQSVTVANMTRRYDQQIRVMQCMYDCYGFEKIKAFEPGLRRYMLHALGAISMNTIMFCCSGGDDETRRSAYAAFWKHTLDADAQLYRYLRTRSYPAIVLWMPWRLRGHFMLAGYKVLCKINKLG